MADYSLYTNDEEIPSEGIVLKKTRAKSKGGTLTDAVQPGQSVLPNARAAMGQPMDYRQRAADLYAQGEDMYQKYLDKNEGTGEAATLNALAAQFAGEGFAPLQAQFLKKAGSAEDTQAKKAEFLMQQAKAYETLAQTADTARERIRAQQQAQDLNNQLKMMGLQIQQQGLALRAENAAATRGLAQQAALDRQDRQLGEGTQKLSKQAADQVGVYAAVNQLNDRLGNYVGQGKTIPGIGLGSNISLGPLDLSARFIGEEGRLNRAMAQKVLNKIINAESGQSVSTQEAARQLLASMGGGNFTEQDFLNAWENNILPGVNASIANVGAGYSPEVKQRYKQQGGEIDFSKPFVAPKRSDDKSGSAPANKLSSQEQAELDALRKRFGGK